jgi:hypothetical protein
VVRRGLVAIVAAVAASALAPRARAFEQFIGTAPLGMGGASRAWAVGDAGPLLNPSGMTLTKTYTIEAAYAYANRLDDQFFHAAIVDSTSSYSLSGGLYYTYHTGQPAPGVDAHGHEIGLALAFPFGEYMSVGGTVKYFILRDADELNGNGGGLTFDVGITVRPAPVLSLALVGTNLRPMDNSQATQALGYGVAVVLIPSLVLDADGLTRFTADNQTGRKGTSVMAGASYTLAERFAVRLGGGYDASTGNGYASVGLSGMSEIGSIDAGLREDLTRATTGPSMEQTRETVLGISLRLFVPANQTQEMPQ